MTPFVEFVKAYRNIGTGEERGVITGNGKTPSDEGHSESLGNCENTSRYHTHRDGIG